MIIVCTTAYTLIVVMVSLFEEEAFLSRVPLLFSDTNLRDFNMGNGCTKKLVSWNWDFQKPTSQQNFGKMLKIIFHDYKIRNLFVSFYIICFCFSFFNLYPWYTFFSASGLSNQSQSRTQEVNWNWPISQKGCTRYQSSCSGFTLGNRRIRKIDCCQANEGKTFTYILNLVGTLSINMGFYTENDIRNIRKYFIWVKLCTICWN